MRRCRSTASRIRDAMFEVVIDFLSKTECAFSLAALSCCNRVLSQAVKPRLAVLLKTLPRTPLMPDLLRELVDGRGGRLSPEDVELLAEDPRFDTTSEESVSPRRHLDCCRIEDWCHFVAASRSNACLEWFRGIAPCGFFCKSHLIMAELCLLLASSRECDPEFVSNVRDFLRIRARYPSTYHEAVAAAACVLGEQGSIQEMIPSVPHAVSMGALLKYGRVPTLRKLCSEGRIPVEVVDSMRASVHMHPDMFPFDPFRYSHEPREDAAWLLDSEYAMDEFKIRRTLFPFFPRIFEDTGENSTHFKRDGPQYKRNVELVIRTAFTSTHTDVSVVPECMADQFAQLLLAHPNVIKDSVEQCNSYSRRYARAILNAQPELLEAIICGKLNGNVRFILLSDLLSTNLIHTEDSMTSVRSWDVFSSILNNLPVPAKKIPQCSPGDLTRLLLIPHDTGLLWLSKFCQTFLRTSEVHFDLSPERLETVKRFHSRDAVCNTVCHMLEHSPSSRRLDRCLETDRVKSCGPWFALAVSLGLHELTLPIGKHVRCRVKLLKALSSVRHPEHLLRVSLETTRLNRFRGFSLALQNGLLNRLGPWTIIAELTRFGDALEFSDAMVLTAAEKPNCSAADMIESIKRRL
mmetsp:Transcript_7576/g.21505  ORF Transcript_7576/g.21505 Transcript_7576/m.21505 type:complete len:634 (-) Transcript_7576:49-1950(-)